ncbi:hypothetical protein GA0070615_5785 [Micromonospora aurantiaca]|nr:hypothetical protein GA0070615_5785 [Micromonospora aurantiaca]
MVLPAVGHLTVRHGPAVRPLPKRGRTRRRRWALAARRARCGPAVLAGQAVGSSRSTRTGKWSLARRAAGVSTTS